MSSSRSNGVDETTTTTATQKTSCGSCCGQPRDELKEKLTPLQYQITQEKGTERAFTGKYYKMKDDGTFTCVVCAETLFSSNTKYDSGSGWPAFYDVLDTSKVKLKQDMSHGLVRTEVSCANCRAHLGHLFDDGPMPTGKRFCINSAALDFKPVQEQQQQHKQNGGGSGGGNI